MYGVESRATTESASAFLSAEKLRMGKVFLSGCLLIAPIVGTQVRKEAKVGDVLNGLEVCQKVGVS